LEFRFSNRNIRKEIISALDLLGFSAEAKKKGNRIHFVFWNANESRGERNANLL
jgi:hypothetical protein